MLSTECNTELCRLSKYNKENLYYDSDLSSSYVDLEEYATIYFGSGQLVGHFGADDFYVG